MSKYEDSLDEDVSDSELLELSQKRSSPESFQTEKKVGKKKADRNESEGSAMDSQ